jgi:hypothetical protein
LTGPVTVIGLVQGGCLLEDIRITVPQRMAIQIPAHLAERSQSLVDALQQRRVMRLGTPAVVKEVSAQLNTSLRGRGISPQVANMRHDPAPVAPSDERELLVLELEASREECRRLQALNEALQVTLQTMTQQLGKIQHAVEALSYGTGQSPAQQQQSLGRGSPRVVGAVPHFIPPTTLEVAEVRINPSETTSTSNVDEALAALRSLRGKSA